MSDPPATQGGSFQIDLLTSPSSFSLNPMSTLPFNTLEAAEAHVWDHIAPIMYREIKLTKTREELLEYLGRCKGALEAQPYVGDVAAGQLYQLLCTRIDHLREVELRRFVLPPDIQQLLIHQLHGSLKQLETVHQALTKEDTDYHKVYKIESTLQNRHHLVSTSEDRERIILLIKVHNAKHKNQNPIKYEKL